MSSNESNTGTSKQSLVDVIEGFLDAQKLRTLTIPSHDGVSIISTDDEFSLINTYVVVDRPTANIDGNHIADVISMHRLDAPRTDIIVEDEFDIEQPAWKRAVHQKARRTVRKSVFLDGHLRPRSICNDLLRERAAPEHSEPALLSESDFVDQWAHVDGVGTVLALEYLFQQWGSGAAPRLCVALAPAGHGKSKVTHILAKRLARNYVLPHLDWATKPPPPVPILISFGEYRAFTSFTGIILSALNRFGSVRLTIEAFQNLISLRRVLFVLDGYDEMMESNPETASRNVTEFIQSAGPLSRILLTSRSTFYRTSSDVVGQVGDPLLPIGDVQILDLQPFDMSQARRYLALRLEHAGHHAQVLERAQRILNGEGALDVLGSPIFIAEFATSLATDTWSLRDVRRHGSLGFLVKRAFERERVRQDHTFTDEQQRRFLERIALDMLATGTTAYTRDDLELFVAEVVDDYTDFGNELNWTLLVSHHFLLPDSDRPNAQITIRHQVWRDYFQGTALAHELTQGRGDYLLDRRDLPEGVLRALREHTSAGVVANLMCSAPTRTDHGIRNLLRLQLLEVDDTKQKIHSRLGASLAGRDLSLLTISHIDFSDASLANANLSDTHLDHCDLSRSSLTNAVLSRTTFRGCCLPKDLYAADVASVTINGRVMYGPEVSATFPPTESGQVAIGAEAVDFREWSADILRGRLAKFVKRTMGENTAVIDSSVSWTAFMGGTKPKERDFVMNKLFRALHAENFIRSGLKASSSGRPNVDLSMDQDLRNQVTEFVLSGEPGPAIEAVIDRLTR